MIPQRTRLAPAGPDLDRVAGRAESLWERLADGPTSHVPLPDPPAARWDAWEAAVGRGLPGGLDAALALRGLTRDEVARGLVARDRPGPRPAWVEGLAEIVAEMQADAPDGGPRGDDPADPVPFEALLAPAVRVGLRRLGPPALPLPADAARSLRRALLVQLSEIAAPTLEHHLSLRFPRGRRLLQLLGQPVPRTGSRAVYDTFVRDQLETGLAAVLDAHPVLGRLLAAAVGQWAHATRTLLSRLARDLPDLVHTFAAPGATLADVAPTDGDPHHGGHRVVVVALSDGTRVVYKPRDVRVDAAFAAFVGWYERSRPHDVPQLRAPAVLAREGYGWVSFVAQAPCEGADGLDRFYRRAGALIAAMHTLGAADGHFENLVAAGEDPVLVDPEMLLYGRLAASGDEDLGGELLASSIVRTGLLPSWSSTANGRTAYDVSGLGSDFTEAVAGRAQWEHVNTDDMTLRRRPGPPPGQPNRPTLRGGDAVPPVHTFRDALAAGYAAAARWLADAPVREPLAAFVGLPVRLVVRPTRVYTGVAAGALLPPALVDGAAFSIALDALAHAFVADPARPGGAALLQAELDAVHALDVPRFVVRTDTTAVWARDDPAAAPIPGLVLVESGLAEQARRPRVDVAAQVRILDATLIAHAARAGDPDGGDPDDGGPPAAADALRAEAGRIVDEVLGASLVGPDGGRHWLGLAFLEGPGRFQLAALGADLYAGRAGVAAFLSAAGRSLGRPDAAEAALGALSATAREASDPVRAAHLVRRMGLGGLSGVGGLLSALVAVGLVDDAATLAGAISEARIAADRDLDLVGGCAGAIVGLLAVHAAAPGSEALARASACGARLLRARVGAAGARAWSVAGGPPMGGLAHGSSGVALALAQLYAVTGEPALRDAIVEALAFEDTLYDTDLAAWRPTPGERPTVRWCHGAPGIARSRLAVWRATGLEAARRDHDRALALVARANQGLDHLCCGNAGRIDVLATSGRVDDARRVAGAVLRSRTRTGRYRLNDRSGAAALHVGAFQGLAGIGHALLRAADPTVPALFV